MFLVHHNSLAPPNQRNTRNIFKRRSKKVLPIKSFLTLFLYISFCHYRFFLCFLYLTYLSVSLSANSIFLSCSLYLLMSASLYFFISLFVSFYQIWRLATVQTFILSLYLFLFLFLRIFLSTFFCRLFSHV